mmetsp:Transcript_29080/g.43851  ORF Transcript_29080/g.43851 Transcript_29080/m.43851 type:complete len:323 (-) Transcript_29080:707-1675(-)
MLDCRRIQNVSACHPGVVVPKPIAGGRRVSEVHSAAVDSSLDGPQVLQMQSLVSVVALRAAWDGSHVRDLVSIRVFDGAVLPDENLDGGLLIGLIHAREAGHERPSMLRVRRVRPVRVRGVLHIVLLCEDGIMTDQVALYPHVAESRPGLVLSMVLISRGNLVVVEDGLACSLEENTLAVVVNSLELRSLTFLSSERLPLVLLDLGELRHVLELREDSALLLKRGVDQRVAIDSLRCLTEGVSIQKAVQLCFLRVVQKVTDVAVELERFQIFLPHGARQLRELATGRIVLKVLRIFVSRDESVSFRVLIVVDVGRWLASPLF